MIDISIVVLSYNNSICQVLLTLKSILLQKNVRLEIVLADDGSENYPINDILAYFEKYEFKQYKYVNDKKNLGTVKNILRALQYCEGKYIKCIGAGDLLYDDSVLYHVIKKMEQDKARFIFTDLIAYRRKDNGIIGDNFQAPVVKKPYLHNQKEKIQRNIIVNIDYISGASMFFERQYLMSYLSKIEDVVIYQEDILQVLAVIEESIPVYLDIRGVLYEMGSGISTQWSIGRIKNKMWNDTVNFWEFVFEKYGENEFVKVRKRHVEIIKKHGEIVRFLVHLFESPAIAIRSFKRKHFRNNITENLGFLNDSNFLEEFNLKNEKQ